MRPSQIDMPPFRYVTTVLRRRWKLLVACAVLGAFAGIGIAIIVPPSYTAKSQLVIDAQAASIGNVIDDAVVDTRVEMLMSAGHLRRILKSIPGRDAETEQSAAVERTLSARAGAAYARLVARVMSFAGSSATEQDKKAPLEVDLSDLQLEELERSMNVYKERRSRVIAVTYRSYNPAAAATMANRAVEVYIEDLRNQREKARADALRRLEERIPEAKASMEAAEGELRRFATAHGFLDNGEGDDDDVQLAQIMRQLAAARSELAERRHGLKTTGVQGVHNNPQRLSQGDSEGRAAGPDMPSTAALVMSRPVNPQIDVVAPIEAPEASSIGNDAALDAIARDAHVIEARVRYLERWQTRLQDARAQALDAELANREFVRIAASSLHIYDALLRRRTELLSQESLQPDARILSLAATPDKPSSPDTILFILPTTIFALLSGMLLSLVLERGNRTVRSARVLNEDEQPSDIVLLPYVGRQDRRPLTLAYPAQPFSIFADALRLVSAMCMAGKNGKGGGSSVCLVTSSGPREGKSTLSISLAVYVRTLGRKVLLVDMDFRNPGLSREFESGDGNGILDLLHGLSPCERIKRNDAFDVDYLPLPQRLVDPMLVFTDQAFPKVIKELRQEYDFIVIDGSHLSGTPDAEFLSHAIDRVILVARWGHTTIEAAQAALTYLRDLQSTRQHLERLGTVLTMVHMGRYQRHRFAEVN